MGSVVSCGDQAADTSEARVLVADVAVPSSGVRVRWFTYRIPAPLQSEVQPGVPVMVTLNGREAIGFALSRRSIESDDPLFERLVDIVDVVSGAQTLTPDQIAMAAWLADRYACSVADAVRAVSPAIMNVRLQRWVCRTDAAAPERSSSGTGGAGRAQHVLTVLDSLGGTATYKELEAAAGVSSLSEIVRRLARDGLVAQSVVTLPPVVRARTVAGVELAQAPADLEHLSDKGRSVAEFLVRRARDGARVMTVRELCDATKVGPGVVKTLISRGVLLQRSVPVRRSATAVGSGSTAPTLNDAQRAALALVLRAMEAPSEERRPILLHGVTGSGKTEVYLAAIAAARARGREAVLIVPEIALTAQVLDLVRSRFGDDAAILHSALGSGERYDEWRRLAAGDAGIAVGARSAVFAPVRNPGLLIVDEEHEGSYKQETAPRYHARDVALERARRSDAVVVLGSATPSLETYYAATSGRMELAEMPARVSGRPLPEVRVVDMREEFKDKPVMFSDALAAELAARVGTGEQAILFLNRRGYAQFVLCRECGYVHRCRSCAVSLTFHAEDRTMRCHHCGRIERPADSCPECRGHKLRAFGLGTERVEQEIARLLPGARVARMDRDTTSRKGSHSKIVGRFRSGEADILVGTQMIAKGFDFPSVTLVGVISADTGLHVPDFRASERTFQLLTQVAGRAGRGDKPGLVLIQTFTPDHVSIEAASRQDYAAFYAAEMPMRRELRYPPFSRLANIVATNEDAERASAAAASVAQSLRGIVEKELEIIGPAPCPLSRLRGQHRWHVVARAAPGAPLEEWLQSGLQRVSGAHRRTISVDVDPTSMA